MAYRPNILLVEDNLAYAARLCQELSSEYKVIHFCTSSEVRAFLEHSSCELFIIDLNLGQESGFDLAMSIDNQMKKPVIYLTASPDVANRITGFTLGADDFIQKPVDFVELRVRIKNVLSRYQSTQVVLEKASIKVDFIARKAFIKNESQWQEVQLSGTEFNLLAYFLRNAGAALSRRQILDSIWPNNFNVSDRTIDAHIFSIRKKLGNHAIHIESVFGLGYRFQEQVDSSSC